MRKTSHWTYWTETFSKLFKYVQRANENHIQRTQGNLENDISPNREYKQRIKREIDVKEPNKNSGFENYD